MREDNRLPRHFQDRLEPEAEATDLNLLGLAATTEPANAQRRSSAENRRPEWVMTQGPVLLPKEDSTQGFRRSIGGDS